jgi:two-component system CitB family sensor kinase
MRMSVARQIFLLQVVLVVVVLGSAAAIAYVDERDNRRSEAADRTAAVALTVAASPTVAEALATDRPSRLIQPYAERVRRETGTDFVVVMALDRTRFSHPNPDEIGRPFVGDLGDAPAGETFTQEYTGTLGPSVRSVVPVLADGEVVALVAVGIIVERIDRAFRERMAKVGLVALALLGIGALGTGLISRRLSRQTHGMGEQELARMYEYYDSVLHAVREGLLLLDQDARVQLVNDEARRLLALGEDAVGLRVTELGVPEELAASLATGDGEPDEIHLVGDRALVVNQAPARWHGRTVGSVVTLRDHTELRAVSGELDTVRSLTEVLRSRNHEADNRLHTVVSLIEIGRPEEAVEFATAELEVAQSLADRVTGAVSDPVTSALLLGKTAQAAERGIDLEIEAGTRAEDVVVSPGDMVTLLGNLIDNAFDAVADQPRKWVRVRLRGDRAGLDLTVEDSGPGLPAGLADRVFQRGWSTKRGDAMIGRGLGLALVGQVARRYGGQVEVGRSPLGGASFHVAVPVTPAVTPGTVR